MILAKIDVTKIDKSKLFKGAKGTYLDICLMETPDDKFGNDYRIVQSLSKEDRAAGLKGAIIGNGKKFGAKPREQAPAHPPIQPQPMPPKDAQEDIPF